MMKCWVCGNDAHAICRFCGRAICKDHAKKSPFIITVYDDHTVPKAIVVADTVWCGICKPQPAPVSMPELG